MRRTHRIHISVVIPTKDRPNDIEELLRMLYDQTISPMEIIVVDDSVSDKTEKIVLNFQRKFAEKGAEIKYIRGDGKGISHARNLGFSHSTGEICLFLDDDIIINKCYIEEILKVYKSFPNVLGVSGYILNLFSPFSALRNTITRLFYGFYGEPDKCQVRPLGMSYPYNLNKVINCEWLSGTNSSYRRSVLEFFKWDENLKRYSLCEDKDLSYRIHKRFPNSLFLTPYARVIHKASPSGRLSDKYVIYSGAIYSTYIFFKNWKHSLLNMIIFVWGMFFGYLMLRILSGNANLVIYQIGAYINLLKNFKKVRKGNLSFLKNVR